jgi:hypothetical protein
MNQTMQRRVQALEHLDPDRRQVVCLRVVYAGTDTAPPLEGPTYVYVMSVDGQWRREEGDACDLVDASSPVRGCEP